MEPTPRKELSTRALRTRQRLIDAAESIFNKEGYFQTDSNKIARAADLSPGSFYKHFAHKKEIFFEVYNTRIQLEWQMILEHLDSAKRQSGNLKLIINQLTNAVYEHHSRYQGLRRDIRALSALDEDLRARQKDLRETQAAALAQIVSELGYPRPTIASCLTVILSVERIVDCMVEGSVSHQVELRETLDEMVFNLLVAPIKAPATEAPATGLVMQAAAVN